MPKAIAGRGLRMNAQGDFESGSLLEGTGMDTHLNPVWESPVSTAAPRLAATR